MSKAVELIVADYVKGEKRRALAELLAHRRKMLGDLQAVFGIDLANAIQAVQDELAIIEASLEELKPSPGSLPRTRELGSRLRARSR